MNISRLVTPSVLVAVFSALIYGCGSGGGSSEDSSPTPTPSATLTPSDNKVWTIAEILSEPANGGAGGEPKCGGEFGFKRCICPNEVPGYVRYRPAVTECNGNAAAILSGRLLNAFSVVVRDTQNRDRWPVAGSGYGGCSFEVANSKNPPNSCSAFKAQDRFKVGGGIAEVYCFGESGYSEIFEDAARLTVKLTDDPNSSEDEIERFCLNGATNPLN